MALKPETAFRIGYFDPFIKRLKNTCSFSIQQVSINGDPDKLLCIRGKFVACELKAKGGKLRPLQEYRLNQVRVAGGITLVVSPDNWETTKKYLVQLDQGEI